MLKLLLALLLFLPTSSTAKLLNLKELTLFGGTYTGEPRFAYITENGLPDRHLSYRLGVIINTELSYLYFNNQILSITDNSPTYGGGQFRYIEYSFQVGIHAFNFLDLEYGHASGHTLDNTRAVLPYPVQDYLQFKLKIQTDNSPSDLLFW